jgi:hypothetical protein
MDPWMSSKALVLDALVERVASWPENAQREAVDSLLSIEARLVGAYTMSAAGARRVANTT